MFLFYNRSDTSSYKEMNAYKSVRLILQQKHQIKDVKTHQQQVKVASAAERLNYYFLPVLRTNLMCNDWIWQWVDAEKTVIKKDDCDLTKSNADTWQLDEFNACLLH